MFRILAYALAFLTCVAVCASVRSHRVKQAILLLASYTLYFTWGTWFAAVLIGSPLVNYAVGEWIKRKRSGLALSIGIFLNLALLSTFKYLPEAALHLPFSSLQRFAHLALPLGISFWTFQAMSYLLDLYQGEELNASLFEFALYMVFFPVTISGPICRMPEMLPQFRSENPTPLVEIADGLRRVAIGVFMMLIARLLGQGILAGDGIVSGFDRLTRWSGADAWCLALGYGLQLFFDFAGYSHIAIGAAKAIGFTIPENFSRPFASTTPSIFWTRWHMSLSFWIRDYVFFPLMRLRREVWWRNATLIISMILFGLWHKASLLFLLWGCYHGILLVLHRQIESLERERDWTPPETAWTALSWITTISLVNLGWVFFRANSLPQARQMLSAILSPESYRTHFVSGSLYLLVACVAISYAVTLRIIDSLNRYSAEEISATGEPAANNTDGGHAASYSGFTAAIARWRWFWITPLYAVALLFLLIITLSHGTSTAQMMYGNF